MVENRKQFKIIFKALLIFLLGKKQKKPSFMLHKPILNLEKLVLNLRIISKEEDSFRLAEA